MSKIKTGEKALALVDGHHYLHVLKAALEYAEQTLGYSIAGVLLLGRPDKLGSMDALAELELPVVAGSDDFLASLEKACGTFEPEIVLDLSGAPVLDFSARLRIAGFLLGRGVKYAGPDFQFSPVPQPDLPSVPTLGILGLGKRVGKTSICTFAAKHLSESGMKPAVVTMSRGGPITPILLHGDISTEFLLNEVTQGRHAASDCYEEALVTGLPTIGCFRVGGGLSGSSFYSTVEEGTRIANGTDCDMLVYEGSGDTAPPVRLDAKLLVVSALLPPAYLAEYFGPVFVEKADLIVITGCEKPVADPEKIAGLMDALRRFNSEAPIRMSVLRPVPLGDIKGKKVAFATTAPEVIADKLVDHLKKTYGCEIVAVTSALSDRALLRKEMSSILSGVEKPDTLLTELKAASIQIAASMAIEAGVEVIYCSNVPEAAEHEEGDLKQDINVLGKLSMKNFRKKHPPEQES